MNPKINIVKVTFDQYIAFVDLIQEIDDEEIINLMKEELKRFLIVNDKD